MAREAATSNGLGTDGTRSPEVRHHRIAGPVGGLPTTSRPGESSRWEKLVDALSVRLTDAGSIPAASTSGSRAHREPRSQASSELATLVRTWRRRLALALLRARPGRRRRCTAGSCRGASDPLAPGARPRRDRSREESDSRIRVAVGEVRVVGRLRACRLARPSASMPGHSPELSHPCAGAYARTPTPSARPRQ